MCQRRRRFTWRFYFISDSSHAFTDFENILFCFADDYCLLYGVRYRFNGKALYRYCSLSAENAPIWRDDYAADFWLEWYSSPAVATKCLNIVLLLVSRMMMSSCLLFMRFHFPSSCSISASDQSRGISDVTINSIGRWLDVMHYSITDSTLYCVSSKPRCDEGNRPSHLANRHTSR